MVDEIVAKVDDKGRVAIPKEIREASEIEKGEALFIDADLGQVKVTRAVKDPMVKLKEYTEKEYKEGNTRDLKDYAQEKGIKLNE
jgi:AbrB family looped-hinge helix DNA binding protein